MKQIQPKLVCPLLVFLFSFINGKDGFGQGIGVAQKCPDVEINHIINFKKTNARLSDFRGKPLILDFWFSSCTACLQSFPKIDSLKKEFGNSIEILLVTHENEVKARNIFSRVSFLNKLKLSSVVSDTVLRLLFPHRSAPHEIWIDGDGVVRAITSHEYVTKENLLNFVKGKPLNLPLKKDNMEYSSLQPLIFNDYENHLLQYSYFSGFQPGLSGSLGILAPVIFDNKRIEVRGINVTTQELYKLAYNKWGMGLDFHLSRIVAEFEVSEISSGYCYDLICRDTSRSNALRKMRMDLDRFFGLYSSLEKRKIKCLVLHRTSVIDRLKSKHGLNRGATHYAGGKLIVENVKLSSLIENTLNYGIYAWAPFQIIDETGYKGKVDLILPEKFSNIEVINKSIEQYDLKLTEEEREMDVIILKKEE